MQTQIFRLDPQEIDPTIIQRAGACIRAGGLVAFPTETVYGLGANALDAEGIARIFAAKGRPHTDPLIVHVASLAQMESIARDIPPLAYQLATRFWAGALTLILQRAGILPPLVSANLETVAVRMPNHPIALALIQAAGVPIAAPSANTFTRPSPTTAAHVLEDLNGRFDLLLDGGTTSIGLESTVLDLTNTPPILLRPGGVTVEALREVVPDLVVRPRYLEGESAAAAPGQLLKHYSPNAQVILFNGERDAVLAKMRDMAHGDSKTGLLLLAADVPFFQDTPAEIFNLGTDLAAVSQNLFAGLRALDARGVALILVRGVAQEGLGLAVGDRLLRAAEGRVVVVD